MNEIGGKNVLLLTKLGKSGTGLTLTAANDQVTFTGHGLVVGDKIQFANIATTTAISAATDYYVAAVVDSSNFTITATDPNDCPGSPAIVDIDLDGTADFVDVFNVLGGLRSKDLGGNAELIDVTNHDSDQHRAILSGAGIKSWSVSGSGISQDRDTSIDYILSQFESQALTDFRFIINESGDYYQGSFKITTFNVTGDYNAEASWSISLESSGCVTKTTV